MLSKAMEDNHDDTFVDEEGMEPLPLAKRNQPFFLISFIGGSCLIIVSVLLLVVAFVGNQDGLRETCQSEMIQWDVYNYTHSTDDNQRCPRTAVYPSRSGCPVNCVRPDRAEKTEALYFFSIGFAFGESDHFAVNGTMPPKSAYDNGVNFQCPDELVENFVNAGASYVARFENASGVSQVIMNPKLHTTLSYICCLTEDEANWAREIARKWIMDSYPFHFQMGFNKVECMSPRENTWGIGLMGDEQTQCTLMKMNLEIQNLLLAHNIPIITPRRIQYRFHMSLAAVETNTTKEKDSNVGGQIQDFTKTMSSKYGSLWTGLEGKMTVQHWPRVWDLHQHI